MTQPSQDGSPTCFTCHRCGNCCKGAGDVFVSPTEAKRIAAHLKLSIIDFYERYTHMSGNRRTLTAQDNLDCVFLEDEACTVHPVKPDQCANWPYWPELIDSSYGFEYGKSYCKGLEPFTHTQFRALKGRFAEGPQAEPGPS